MSNLRKYGGLAKTDDQIIEPQIFPVVGNDRSVYERNETYIELYTGKPSNTYSFGEKLLLLLSICIVVLSGFGFISLLFFLSEINHTRHLERMEVIDNAR